MHHPSDNNDKLSSDQNLESRPLKTLDESSAVTALIKSDISKKVDGSLKQTSPENKEEKIEKILDNSYDRFVLNISPILGNKVPSKKDLVDCFMKLSEQDQKTIFRMEDPAILIWGDYTRFNNNVRLINIDGNKICIMDEEHGMDDDGREW